MIFTFFPNNDVEEKEIKIIARGIDTNNKKNEKYIINLFG